MMNSGPWIVPEAFPPPTLEEQAEAREKCRLEMRKRNAFRRVEVKDYENVWTHPELPHVKWTCDADDRRLHIRNKVGFSL